MGQGRTTRTEKRLDNDAGGEGMALGRKVGTCGLGSDFVPADLLGDPIGFVGLPLLNGGKQP